MKPHQHSKVVDEMPESGPFRFSGLSIISKEVVHASCRRAGDVITMKVDGSSCLFEYSPATLSQGFNDHAYRVAAHTLTDWQADHLASSALRAEAELRAINEHFDVSEAIARVIEIREKLEEL